MYKVFYNDRIVFFVDSDKFIFDKESNKIYYFKNVTELGRVVHDFQTNLDLKELLIVSNDTTKAFKAFSDLFSIIDAAGGLVKSINNEYLVIYRRDKWDLPKGKVEEGETPENAAIREIHEECGITDLKIENLLHTSYHTYTLNDKNILKRTYWYKIIHSDNQVPTPQADEDITEAKWMKPKELAGVFQNTYISIAEVLLKAGISYEV